MHSLTNLPNDGLRLVERSLPLGFHVYDPCAIKRSDEDKSFRWNRCASQHDSISVWPACDIIGLCLVSKFGAAPSNAVELHSSRCAPTPE
jgi:hypothetical protein